MLITYEDYTGLGYSTVREEEFPRYEAMATAYALRQTFGRVIKAELDPIWQNNLRGLCELIDAYYSSENNLNAPVTSFSNGRYSETYATGVSLMKSTDDILKDILSLYFTAAQRSRRVMV